MSDENILITGRIIISILNEHSKNCGQPPFISMKNGEFLTVENSSQHTLEKISYIGYFENMYGDQWIYLYSRESERGMIFGGSIGWEYPILFSNEDHFYRTEMTAEEILWVEACIRASGAV